MTVQRALYPEDDIIYHLKQCNYTACYYGLYQYWYRGIKLQIYTDWTKISCGVNQ